MAGKRKNIDTKEELSLQAFEQEAAKKRRVSSRLSTRKPVLLTETDQNSPLDDKPHVRKRARRGPVVGRLAGLMELPMDVLFEIFGHLNPLDVLRLARTTKQFRSMLMDRSSRFIWIAARKNVPGLPGCPPYMSEPQFANLVFDTHCHECLAPNTRSVDWRISRRICMKCTRECFVEDYHVFSGESVYKAVPSKEGKRGRLCYYKRDLDEFQGKRDSFTKPEERVAFVKERKAIVSEMEKHAALLTTWSNNQYNARSEERDDLRRERKHAIIEELTKLGWGPEIEKIPHADDLSHHRLVKQPTRLTPRIWSNIRPEMIRYMEQMKTQRLQRERKALIISRKRVAILILRAYKSARLPFTDIMPEPVDFCAFPEVSEIVELPTETEVTEASFAGVVAQMDELVARWRRNCYDMLTQQFQDLLSFRKVENTLFDAANIDSASTTDPKGKGKAKADSEDNDLAEVLSLATTVFRCKSCTPSSFPFFDDDPWSDILFPGMLSPRSPVSRSPLFYPSVMGHRCLTKQRGYSPDYIFADPTIQLHHSTNIRMKWSCGPLQLDETAEEVVSKIVKTCGMDPHTTTTAQMDSLNPMVACLECVTWDRETVNLCQAQVFTWRAAVDHCFRAHRKHSKVEWKHINESFTGEIVNTDDTNAGPQNLVATLVSAVLGTNMNGLGPSTSHEDAIWLCTHCLDLPDERECMGLTKIRSHVSNSHGIEDPTEIQDYYHDFAAPRESSSPKFKVTLTMERPVDTFPTDYDYNSESDYSSDFECPCDMCGGYHDYFDSWY